MISMTSTMHQQAQQVEREQALQTALNDVRALFGKYRAPALTLDVCLACCMDAALEKQMREWPLHELTIRHFYAYNDTAKGNVQPAGEIKYFVPRMLELLVQRQQLHHSTELFMDRWGRCDADVFTQRERSALQAFALAHFALGLEQWPNARDQAFMGDDAFTMLLMWDIGGLDIAPLLAHWLHCDSPSSALHYVEASYWNYWGWGRVLGNAFARDRTSYQGKMTAWLTAAQNRAWFANRMLALSEGGPWSDGSPSSPHGDLQQRVGAVFDALIE
jgi:hypothetical protein